MTAKWAKSDNEQRLSHNDINIPEGGGLNKHESVLN